MKQIETKCKTLKRTRCRPRKAVNKISDDLIIGNPYPKHHCALSKHVFFVSQIFPLSMILMHLHVVNQWAFVDIVKIIEEGNEEFCLWSYGHQGCISLYFKCQNILHLSLPQVSREKNEYTHIASYPHHHCHLPHTNPSYPSRPSNIELTQVQG